MNGWNLAGLATKQIGGRILNGVAERKLGFDADVTGTLGMAGETFGPIVTGAYSRQPGETFISVWGRRVKWTGGILVGGAALTGLCYLGWRFLAEHDDQ